MKRVNSQLETINEKQPVEEGVAAMSQGLQAGAFDIEASHSFSLRNYGKEKMLMMESLKNGYDAVDGGKESAMSNYSKI